MSYYHEESVTVFKSEIMHFEISFKQLQLFPSSSSIVKRDCRPSLTPFWPLTLCMLGGLPGHFRQIAKISGEEGKKTAWQLATAFLKPSCPSYQGRWQQLTASKGPMHGCFACFRILNETLFRAKVIHGA